MYIPEEIHLHKKSKQVEIIFPHHEKYFLSCEYLRVFSPSAEVRGHREEVRKLVPGKKDVSIVNIEPVGNYAVKFVFDDGHATGLFTWEILHDLCVNYEHNWQNYLSRLKEAGFSR